MWYRPHCEKNNGHSKLVFSLYFTHHHRFSKPYDLTLEYFVNSLKPDQHDVLSTLVSSSFDTIVEILRLWDTISQTSSLIHLRAISTNYLQTDTVIISAYFKPFQWCWLQYSFPINLSTLVCRHQGKDDRKCPVPKRDHWGFVLRATNYRFGTSHSSGFVGQPNCCSFKP